MALSSACTDDSEPSKADPKKPAGRKKSPSTNQGDPVNVCNTRATSKKKGDPVPAPTNVAVDPKAPKEKATQKKANVCKTKATSRKKGDPVTAKGAVYPEAHKQRPLRKRLTLVRPRPPPRKRVIPCLQM